MSIEQQRPAFEREERYVVIKISHLRDGFSSRETQVNRLKYAYPEALVDCVVVEADWPEYEPVWQMIEARMTGAELVGQQSFQSRVQPWLMECFGPMIAGDREERNHRFFEEASELVQACGMTASEAHQLVDYVWNRPVGKKHQEVGGVMVTLAALCLANDLDMHADGETELARINVPEIVAKIRAKQAAKPKHSPLPMAATIAQSEISDERIEAGAKKLSALFDYPWEYMPEQGRNDMRSKVRTLLAEMGNE
ncbi:hypothetical protein HNQ50_000796 [Silvimonas terrae]|uniref:Uncharacterized protein n=1 Tax=Silvimonas terrae TaxID=300266 RepID=A0A840RCD1_9NEIS|nr:hypothetical protein [Silvimonas terrae]MBB5190086.1 hypothetical protein [Silvimonas terrae]